MDTKLLESKAAWLRRELFEMFIRAKKGHIPSCFSCVDILVTLYYGGHLTNTTPKDPDRDRVFISKGHAGMALYPILCDLGYVDKSEVQRFTKPGGVFRFYPDPSIPGIEAITGSLGHGLGIAIGHALAAKRDNKSYKNFVILGDGECYEGSTWEQAMFAAHHKLDNLVAIIDKNDCCIMGHTDDCLSLGSLEDKFHAFGWGIVKLDGHDFNHIDSALTYARRSDHKPTAIIANTTKGKGISFMEGKPEWHNKFPSEEQIQIALKELA